LFLIVVRLLAVYFATCALALFLAGRFVRRLSRPIVLFLVFAPGLITGRAMLTGGVFAPIDIVYQAHPLAALRQEMAFAKTKSPILGDVVFQEIPWRKAVREAVKNGRLPLWNRFILAGEPLLAMQQPAVFHPSTVIGMLLPLAQAWTFEMSFTLFLALLCGWLFCRELGLSPVACCVGAVGWAFSDYLLFFLGYPLAPAVAPFPLLLLGLSRIARERSARSAGITVISLLLGLVAGHSETVLHMVAAAGLYFLFCLVPENRRARVRAILVSLAAGAVTIGLAAVLLLPHIEALPQTLEYFFRNEWYANVKRSVPWPDALVRIPQLLIPYALGSSGHGSYLEGQSASVGYAGSVLVPLAAVGLFSRRREKWIFLALGLIGVSLWARVPGISDVVCALPLFDIALNERLIFLAAFAVAVLAAFGTEKILSTGSMRGIALAVISVLSLLVLSYLLLQERLLGLEMPLPWLRGQFLLQFVPLSLLGIWLLATNGRARRATAAFVVGLVLVQRAAEASSLYPVAPNRAFYPPLRLFDRIPRDQPYRTTAVGYIFVPNISALYELEDVRGYEAMTFRRLFETYPLWCVHQAVWFNRIDDPTKPFLSFLNVKYFLFPEGVQAPPGWPTIAEDLGIRVVENPGVLPRAFAPAMFRIEPDGQKQLQIMGEIHDFARLGVVEKFAGQSPGVWIPNGQASVRISAYAPARLSIDVTAGQPALIATSVTGWRGWRLKIDGKRADLVPYNRAFLSFVVPAGRHRAELEYFPSSFVFGAWVSGLTLLSLCVAALLKRRRQGPFQTPTVRVPTFPTTR
jgi:hypothetical protein